MWALFGFLFATHFGAGTAHADPVHLSIREEVRIVAADRNRVEVAPEPTMSLDASPAAPNWPGLLTPGSSPHFRPYQPEEYVAQMMSRLQVDQTPLGRSAVWMAGAPLQVDARPDRFYVRLKFRM